jgi:N-acetylmuramoyl-L-alanine amidase
MNIKTILGLLSLIGILILLIVVCEIGINYSISQKAIKTNATPITNKTIVLDAGHGVPDEGAVGFTGTTEQAINLEIALRLQELIEQSGAKVVLTRSDENSIYSADSTSIRNKKISDIKNREYIVNSSNADIFISIHLNKYQDSKYSGWQTFYQSKIENSKLLATSIQNELNNNITYDNTRIPMAIKGVYLMEHINIPGVVVECGFISNPEEEQLLKQETHQSKLAWGIYTGIQKYFEKTTI